MRSVLVALLVTIGLSAAQADTLYVQGVVKQGGDPGGYFGGGDLTGLPFVVEWIGTDCNCYSNFPGDGNPVAITSALVTINGMTVDIAAFGVVRDSQWRDVGGNPWNNQLETSKANITIWSPYQIGPDDKGIFGLPGAGAILTPLGIGPTLADAFFVPSPVLGTGLPGLMLAGLLGWWRRKRA